VGTKTVCRLLCAYLDKGLPDICGFIALFLLKKQLAFIPINGV
jgi:hypothetical protein